MTKITKTLRDWACAETQPETVRRDEDAITEAVHVTRHVAELCKALRPHYRLSDRWHDLPNETVRAAEDLARLARFTQNSLERGVPDLEDADEVLVALIEATTHAATILQVIGGSGRYRAGGVDALIRRMRLLETIRMRAHDQRRDNRNRNRQQARQSCPA